MSRTRMVAGMCAIALMALGAGTSYSQDYPSKTIRIVTAAAGGGSDFASRLIAQGIAGSLGQPVIVENRTGFEAQVAVSKASPDGYTVLFTGQSFWIGPLLRKVPYDPVRDFSPILIATASPLALVTHPSLPVRSVKELIVLAKAKPGQLNYGAGSPGAAPHLAMELFKTMAGVNIVWVPYKGIAQATTDLLGGHLQVMFPAVGLVTPHVGTNRMKVLAVTSAQPTELLPGVPTVAASGLPGYVMVSPDGMMAPAKTPAAIISRLNREIVRYLNTAEAKKQFLDTGAEVVGSTPEEFAATIKSETAILGKVVKDSGMRTDQ